MSRKLLSAVVLFAVSVGSNLASAAVVSGTFEAKGACAEGYAELWFSDDQTLLYQAQVPVGGSFEFHAVPGTYHVVATTSGGCMGERKVELSSDGARKKLTLEAERPRRPASVKSAEGGK